MIFVYIQTFAIFPGVTNYTTFTCMDRYGKYQYIILVTLFNFGDTVGRYSAPKKFFLTMSKRTFYTACIIRTFQIIPFVIFAFFDPP